tara:strand:- start:10923 stop:11486 length:564 start_codon:yes stop_codon:yes gene_type:complete
VRSPFNFIVTPVNERRYDNIKKIEGVDFITSVSEEDHTASNRFAQVKELPINYTGPIQKGDILVVHHNVFKFYNDMQGRQQSGRSFFKDDLFLVDEHQFFLYKNQDAWKAHGKYCFIIPGDIKESYLSKPGTEEPLFGTIKYINQELIDLGLKEGDEVSYQPDSEYPFVIDEEKLYRMYTDNITFLV